MNNGKQITVQNLGIAINTIRQIARYANLTPGARADMDESLAMVEIARHVLDGLVKREKEDSDNG